MRICIVTPRTIGLTETFIKAHIDLLPHYITCLDGYFLHNYSWNGQPLREWYGQRFSPNSSGWLNALPRFIEFRLRRKFYPPTTDLEIVSDFLGSQKIDVVLAEYGTAAALVTPACKAAGIPLVAHFHGIDAARTKTLEEFRERYCLMFDYASTVISVSNSMSGALIGMGCPPEKICYNPYGPDQAFFQVKPDYSSMNLLTVGRHTAKKAPYLALDSFRMALEEVPSLRLCMIGDGELFEVSERLVAAWGLEDKVDLVGAADPDVIRLNMRQSFAFLQHSVQARNGDSEGMPVAILEAGASGLPIISTLHAGIPDAVVHKRSGFIVEPGSSTQMCERIIQLAKDKNLARKMGEAARMHVQKNFSMDRHVKKLDEVLSSSV